MQGNEVFAYALYVHISMHLGRGVFMNHFTHGSLSVSLVHVEEGDMGISIL